MKSLEKRIAERKQRAKDNANESSTYGKQENAEGSETEKNTSDPKTPKGSIEQGKKSEQGADWTAPKK